MQRNVNYDKFAQKQSINKDFKGENRIIVAIRNNNIADPETLSGKDLVPRDPILQSLTSNERKINESRYIIDARKERS